MNWRLMTEERPEDGQECLTKMKHGIIQGHYDASDGTFTGYYWSDIEWWAKAWMPIEEAE